LDSLRVYLISYDLHQPGRIYPKVEAVLRQADGGWCHAQGSVWFVDSTAGTTAWRNALAQAGDQNDEFFVTRINPEWASSNMTTAGAWLSHPARRW
jgi:hypothetical protein